MEFPPSSDWPYIFHSWCMCAPRAQDHIVLNIIICWGCASTPLALLLPVTEGIRGGTATNCTQFLLIAYGYKMENYNVLVLLVSSAYSHFWSAPTSAAWMVEPSDSVCQSARASHPLAFEHGLRPWPQKRAWHQLLPQLLPAAAAKGHGLLQIARIHSYK